MPTVVETRSNEQGKIATTHNRNKHTEINNRTDKEKYNKYRK